MANLLTALHGNPLIPTPHWEPRCELCGLRRTHPEVYGWLTQTMMGTGPDTGLTQQQIAAEVERRTGLSITQSQVSHHKVQHLDPSLQDAVESMTGHLVLLDYCAGMDPAEMALAYVKLAMVKTGQLLAEADSAKAAAPLAGATAKLARVLHRAGRESAETEMAEVEARLAALREHRDQADYAAQFADWVRKHYPDLEPLLADPERLKTLLKGTHA